MADTDIPLFNDSDRGGFNPVKAIGFTDGQRLSAHHVNLLEYQAAYAVDAAFKAGLTVTPATPITIQGDGGGSGAGLNVENLNAGKLNVDSDATVGGDLGVDGATTTGSLEVTGADGATIHFDLSARDISGRNISATGTMHADGQVSSSTDMYAGNDMQADNNVLASVDVNAGRDTNAGRDATATRDMVAGRNITAQADLVSEQDTNSGRDVTASRKFYGPEYQLSGGTQKRFLRLSPLDMRSEEDPDPSLNRLVLTFSDTLCLAPPSGHLISSGTVPMFCSFRVPRGVVLDKIYITLNTVGSESNDTLYVQELDTTGSASWSFTQTGIQHTSSAKTVKSYSLAHTDTQADAAPTVPGDMKFYLVTYSYAYDVTAGDDQTPRFYMVELEYHFPDGAELREST